MGTRLGQKFEISQARSNDGDGPAAHGSSNADLLHSQSQEHLKANLCQFALCIQGNGIELDTIGRQFEVKVGTLFPNSHGCKAAANLRLSNVEA